MAARGELDQSETQYARLFRRLATNAVLNVQAYAYEPLLTRADGVLKLIPKLPKHKP